ncbi:MAG: hypothetical protein ACLP50_09470 [Solirubrobacteraceae bacterium]
MSRAEVRGTVISVLAAKKRCDPGELEAELRAGGPECPCDSQWLVKAGVGAARALGVRLRPSARDASAFRSVEALTTYLHRLVEGEEAA